MRPSPSVVGALGDLLARDVNRLEALGQKREADVELRRRRGTALARAPGPPFHQASTSSATKRTSWPSTSLTSLTVEQGLTVDRLQLLVFTGFNLAVRHHPLDEGRQLVLRLRARVAHDA